MKIGSYPKPLFPLIELEIEPKSSPEKIKFFESRDNSFKTSYSIIDIF